MHFAREAAEFRVVSLRVAVMAAFLQTLLLQQLNRGTAALGSWMKGTVFRLSQVVCCGEIGAMHQRSVQICDRRA